MKYIGQDDYNHDKKNDGKIGILLCNLGTPDAPDTPSLRRYLKEFLSDPRVVEVPRLIWWFILNLIILRFRPSKSAKMYQQVWTEDGSPLLIYSKQQLEKVKEELTQIYGDRVVFALGMRYGNPSMESAIAELKAQNAQQVIVLPLYPQYSGATSGSTFDALADIYKEYRWVPEITFINSYHKHPKYIQAIANSIRQHVAQHGKPERILFSYHGTPERYLKNGDPYYCFCQQTTRLVKEAITDLSFADEELMTCFQSRFGKEPWLQPYTDETLEALPKEGVKNIAVICPGFSSDCLETIEEIAQEGKEEFMEAGGESYHYIPALNAEPEHIEALAAVLKPYIEAHSS